MAGRATREGVPADRAERRRGVGFGLGPKLQGVAEQFPNVLGDLDFEMAEVLVTRAHEALDRKFQRARHARRQWRERGGGASSEGGGGRLAAGNGHAQNVQRTLPCKKLRCAPRAGQRQLFLSTGDGCETKFFCGVQWTPERRWKSTPSNLNGMPVILWRIRIRPQMASERHPACLFSSPLDIFIR